MTIDAILLVLNWIAALMVPVVAWMLMRIISMGSELSVLQAEAKERAENRKQIADMLESKYNTLVNQHSEIQARLRSIEEHLRGNKTG